MKAYKLMAYVGQLRGRGDSRRWDLCGVSATPPAAGGKKQHQGCVSPTKAILKALNDVWSLSLNWRIDDCPCDQCCHLPQHRFLLWSHPIVWKMFTDKFAYPPGGCGEVPMRALFFSFNKNEWERGMFWKAKRRCQLERHNSLLICSENERVGVKRVGSPLAAPTGSVK